MLENQRQLSGFPDQQTVISQVHSAAIELTELHTVIQSE